VSENQLHSTHGWFRCEHEPCLRSPQDSSAISEVIPDRSESPLSGHPLAKTKEVISVTDTAWL